MADRFRLIHFKSTDSDRVIAQANDLSRLVEEPSPGVQTSHAPEALDTLSSEIFLKQVTSDLKHTDPRIRMLSLQYLEKLEASVAIPLLQEGVSDPAPEVRSQALRSLIKFRDSGTTPLFRKCLRDPHPGVRIAAIRGMFLSREGIDLNVLLQFLSDESPWVRRKLATLLGWTPMEGTLPILTEMSKDRDAKVRKAALLSLMTLYPEEGRERLFESYRDEDPDIRQWTKKTLEKWVTRSVAVRR